MPYIGKSPLTGNFSELTDVSGSFDGSTTQFALTTRIGGVAVTPVVEAALLISLNGVIQEPTTSYTVSGTNITFTSAPASTDEFFGVVMGTQLDIGTPSDSTVTPAKLNLSSALLPATADGAALGSASLEWSDLYLADSGVIYFGNDQEITLTHSADSGLLLKHTATADDKPINLTLQTGETDMAANDVIGKISFQAPDEGTGTDAILVSAAIQAVAEGDHSSSSNATKLVFMTGASEAAAEKVSISSAGILTIQGENTNTTNATQGVAKAWAHVNGYGTPAFEDSFNKASLTDNATGDYTATIANDMGSADYVLAGTTATAGFFTNAVVNRAMAAGTIRFITSNDDSGFDTDNNSIALHGDLS